MQTQTPLTPARDGAEPERPRQFMYLVRHGQTTFNLEGRLPGQLPSISLTDEGRRQAHRAAVALSATPLSAVVSSPLERARETAEIIARGWALPVRLDARLMDTDVGPWAGQKIADLRQHDPAWPEFVRHPTQPPPGVESLQTVQARSVAVIEELRHQPGLGPHVVVVAHADVVKLIVAYYFGLDIERIHVLHTDNGSVTTLAFGGNDHPMLLALNWTSVPDWLTPSSSAPEPERDAASVSASTEPATPASSEHV